MEGLTSVIVCLDVAYGAAGASASGVLFHAWTDGESAGEIVMQLGPVAEYKPGRFYRRELPCLLAVLDIVQEPLETVVVDGYVWLGDGNVPGLGACLFESLKGGTPVVGVAKSTFAGACHAIPVFRGGSRRPLLVTAAGMDPVAAARNVAAMHGRHRIPTLLKRADLLSRLGLVSAGD